MAILLTYILNRWPISQPKTNKNIRISYSLKYNIRKKIFDKKINDSVV